MQQDMIHILSLISKPQINEMNALGVNHVDASFS